MILGYVRVSSAAQAERGSSLDAQRDRITRYVSAAGLGEPITWIEEPGESASTPLLDRPGGSRIVFTSEGPHHLVTARLDRLFRDVIDGLTTLDRWDAAGGVTVHLVDEGGAEAINVTSASGRFMLTMKLAIAEQERRLVSERTQATVDYRRSQGLVIGPPPYGFRADTEGHLIEDPAEQRTIAEARKLQGLGRTLRSVAAHLGNTGVRTRKGGFPTHTFVRDILSK